MESETDADGLEERLEEIVASTLRIDESAFDDETALGPEGLDVDSLSVVEMAETVDVELGVAIPDDDLQAMDTVGDVKAYVREELD